MGTCSNCEMWNYNSYTENKYGMGVGICMVDGSDTFCDHKCHFCVEKDIKEE